MADTSKSKKPPSVFGSLVDTTLDCHLHCWSCGKDGHTKKDPNCLKFPRDSPQPSKAKKKEEIKAEVKVEAKAKKKP